MLTIGLLLLVYFLVALSEGPRSYSGAMTLFSHPAFKVLLVGLLWSFSFHLLSGVRHLVLDTGHGLERKQARLSAKLIAIGSVVLTLVGSLFLFRHGGHL
jgi:succinate dehydrogenase / fumarate reductase cytochrome b subunit